MGLYGWIKNVIESSPASQLDIEINLCDKCVGAPFPFAIVYDGQEGNCVHLFALRAEKELSSITHEKRLTE